MSFGRNLLSGLRDDLLHLILMPTEKCNFRCAYCYEDFALGRMSDGTVAAVVALMRRRWPALRAMDIAWFGGEPLNAPGVVRTVMREAAAARPDGATLTSSMTTNGYRLDAAMLDELVGLGVTGYQITLDGDAADHDARRPLANGRGTFERIWANMLAARDVRREFAITFRLHAHDDTVEGLRVLIARLAEAFGGDPRFRFFLKPIARLGGANDAAVKVPAAERRVRLAELSDLGVAGGLTRTADDPDYVCYAAKPNSLVVRSDGALAKCTVAFDADRNKVGRLNPDGTVTLDGDKMSRWAGAMFAEAAAARSCPVGAVLAG